MNKKENLNRLMQTTHSGVKRLIEDITDEESMLRGNQLNHIRWLTGHLIYSAGLILECLGEKGAVPNDISKLFSRGSDISDDPQLYPSMSELRKMLYSLYDRIHKVLDALADEDLDKKISLRPGWETTPMDGSLFFCAPEFYHAGQMATVRRILGRERSFG